MQLQKSKSELKFKYTTGTAISDFRGTLLPCSCNHLLSASESKKHEYIMVFKSNPTE